MVLGPQSHGNCEWKGSDVIMGFNPVNPEAIAVFGLLCAVVCFGLEQLGVGLKGADMTKVTKTLALIAIGLGGVPQLYVGVSTYLFGFFGEKSIFMGTIFGFFGIFWVVAGVFFLMGGDKKVMAHFFAVALALVILFTIRALQEGMVWPLGIDLVVIIGLLVFLIIGWYTGKTIFTRLAGICNLLIAFISFFLLIPQIVL